MKILIAIPSYNRPYDIDKRTGYWLKQLTKFDYKVFVEPQESLYYEQSMGAENIIETNDNNGLVGQLVDIGNYAKENGYDLVTKIDDDTYYSLPGKGKAYGCEIIEKSLTEIVKRFSENDNLGVVGFTAGMDYIYNKEAGFKKRKKPIYGTAVVRPEVFTTMDRRGMMFADLLVSLSCKDLGLGIETYYGCQEQRITLKNKGGLQSFDRTAIAKKSYEIMLEKYPKIKPLEDGKYKNDFFDIDVSEYF